MIKKLLNYSLASQYTHWRSLLSLLFLGISLASFTDDKHKPGRQEQRQSTIQPIKKQSVHPFDADPIRFLMRADKQIVSPGEEVTITLTAHYLNIHSALLFTAAGSNAFRLKALLPDGFVQTGGDYIDYIGTELSAVQPTVTYTIKGHFSQAGGNREFRLLRGSYYADASSLFVEKARLLMQVHSAETVRNQQKSARSGGALAFQIISYDCNSGQLQYQFTGGDGSPINVSLPGIFGGTMYADAVASYTFPGDGRVGRAVTGSATQSGNQISINFTNGCNMTTNSTPPTNPNPALGNCSYSEGQYLFTFNSEVMYAHYYNGILYAAYQNSSEFRPQHWLIATGLMDSNTASCFAENDPHTTSNPPTQPTTPTQPTGTCGYSEGQYLFTFNSEVMYAHYYNGVLYAAYQNGSEFRPQHWLVATGLMNSNTASCFAENDPHNGGTSNPTGTGSGNVGGGIDNPTGGCGTGSGLTGFYSNSTDLSGTLVAIRNDVQINFSWGNDSPIPSVVNADGFSVRWFGQIEAPVSGNYTFKTNNDDGTRLWVSEQLLINDWNGHGPTWQQGSIYLTAGQKYTIVIDFVDFGGGAQAQLYWEYPGQSLQLVPGCRLYANLSYDQASQSYRSDHRICDDEGAEEITIGCATFSYCKSSGNVFSMNLKDCETVTSPPGGTPSSGPPPGDPPGNTPNGTPISGGPPAIMPGGPTGTHNPGFTLQINTSSQEASLNKFYSAMQIQHGITFTANEKAVIAEYPELANSIRDYANQHAQKPDLSSLSLNINTATEQQIKEAFQKMNFNGGEITWQELDLLGISTLSSQAYHDNLELYYDDAKKATIITILRYGFHEAAENGFGIANSFKHAFFQIMHCRSFGRTLGAQLAEAHEQGQHTVDSEMDYWNNDRGLEIYDAHSNYSFEEFNRDTYAAVLAGKMRYMKEGWGSTHLTPTNQ